MYSIHTCIIHDVYAFYRKPIRIFKRKYSSRAIPLTHLHFFFFEKRCKKQQQILNKRTSTTYFLK